MQTRRSRSTVGFLPWRQVDVTNLLQLHHTLSSEWKSIPKLGVILPG